MNMKFFLENHVLGLLGGLGVGMIIEVTRAFTCESEYPYGGQLKTRSPNTSASFLCSDDYYLPLSFAIVILSSIAGWGMQQAGRACWNCINSLHRGEQGKQAQAC